MRSPLLLVSCVATAVLCAGAVTADTGSTAAPAAAPSLSDEMLRIWEMRDAVDAAPQSATPFEPASGFMALPDNRLSSPWLVPPPADDTADGWNAAAPAAGRSMTPNIDRLMQRAQEPLVPLGSPVVRSGGSNTANWGGRYAAKGGTGTIDGGRGGDKKDKDPHHDGGSSGDCGPTTPTPEPTTLLLFGGAAAAAAVRRRRTQRSN